MEKVNPLSLIFNSTRRISHSSHFYFFFKEEERSIPISIIQKDLLLRPSLFSYRMYSRYPLHSSFFVTIIYLRSCPNLAVSIHPCTRFSLRSSVHFFCPIFSTVATRSPAERMHDKKGRFARIHIRRESHSRET